MSETADSESRESCWVIVGLCAITASLLLFEVCLTKFVSFKIQYNFVYAIVSSVILGSGFAGVVLHIKAKQAAAIDPWKLSGTAACLYAILLPVVVLLFCWLPLEPNLIILEMLRHGIAQHPFLLALAMLIPLLLYFTLFAIPCFFAGVCITLTLAKSKRPVTSIYFYDLLAAAAGALMCPALLEYLGGYGVIGAAALLGLLSGTAYFLSCRALPRRFFAAAGALVLAGIAGLVIYPPWGQSVYGQEIRTLKNLNAHQLVFQELGGFARTYWNAVARIDITKTGQTRHFETYADLPNQPLLTCRFVFVDGGAPTRQLLIKEPDGDPHLPTFLWASPYMLKHDVKRMMIIGVGGGIDILMAKHFNIPEVEAVELNPSTYKHVLLGQGDPERALYGPALQSDDQTQVTIVNSEARHFASTKSEPRYDLIQATAVDTLTAITSGALALSEGYLYTEDAVADYMRLLRPNGVLSLTHWRLDPPQTSLRMFTTFLAYLDSTGVKEPWRNVVVLGNDWWTDSMMKATPFTEDELNSLRAFARKNGFNVLFDPDNRHPTDPGIKAPEQLFTTLGFMPRDERSKALQALAWNVAPVTDDRPYFYRFERVFFLPEVLLTMTVIIALLLFTIPLAVTSKSMRSGITRFMGLNFAVAGFAFLLFEVTFIQLFTMFVGGPVYSLALVLVAVLVGYACGSKIAERLKLTPGSFAIIGVILLALFVASYLFLPAAIMSMLPLPQAARMAVCALLVTLGAVPVGMPVAMAMGTMRDKFGDAVAWMWGISSAANAVGAMAFGVLSNWLGISGCLLVVAVLYLLACLGFAAGQSRMFKASGDVPE